MDTRVRAAIDKMRHLLGDRHSVRTVSASVNLSPRRLGQLFRKETGMSPSRFLKTLRMERAEYLLQTSFLSVKEVTFQSGMTDVSHFVRDFKKRHRMTPTEFRRRIGQSSKYTF